MDSMGLSTHALLTCLMAACGIMGRGSMRTTTEVGAEPGLTATSSAATSAAAGTLSGVELEAMRM
jgi:hypothetical protein